jgi:glyoxylase-like metal-dependent hydrolase (beta-lactamase superfamily II)
VTSRSFATDAREWFQVGEIEPGLHLVAEPGHVFSWLIAGSERSVLLDTGLGLADIAAAIAPVAATPTIVVNSHVHFDHVGGNELFEHTEMHERSPEWIEYGSREQHLRSYRELAEDMTESWGRLEQADRDGWFMIGPDETLRRWPGRRIAELGWRIDPPQPTRLLADGDTVELGDRTLRVMHTPGHAPDHICLLDEAAGILFAQDQAYYGPLLIYEEGTDLSTYARSARRLADELAGEIRIVYTAHCLRPSVPPRFLGELADAAEAVAGGEAALSPVRGLFGEHVFGADFGYFSILVSPEAAAG